MKIEIPRDSHRKTFNLMARQKAKYIGEREIFYAAAVRFAGPGNGAHSIIKANHRNYC